MTWMALKVFSPLGPVCRQEVYRLRWRHMRRWLVQKDFPVQVVPVPAFSPKPVEQRIRVDKHSKGWQNIKMKTWKVPVLPARELARPAICWFNKPNLETIVIEEGGIFTKTHLPCVWPPSSPPFTLTSPTWWRRLCCNYLLEELTFRRLFHVTKCWKP